MLHGRYHLTGGLACSYYGEPRLTQDVDVVLKAPLEDVRELLASFAGREYYVDVEVALSACVAGRMFQILDQRSFVKIDFHVGEAVPGELSRSLEIELFPGLQVKMVSKTDAILSKLLWIQKGSIKSRHDVIGMLREQDQPYDRDRLEAQARELGVLRLLTELRGELGGTTP